MNDLVIKVSKRSRLIDLDHSTLGIVGENLQEKLIFTFQDEFVDGMARLEYELESDKHYVLMEKVGQSYILPVQNVLLTKEGNIDLQLVITEDKTGTPVFKSEVFTLYCKKSIEAVGEAPSSYELWIEKANRILLETSRVNIDGKKTGNETIITITQRDGNKKSFPIMDGQDGQQGPQGPQGPVGPQGPEGPQGPVGPTPDLSDYVKNTDYATSSKGGVIKANNSYGLGMLANGTLVGGTANYALYNSGSDARIISKGTLENVITGKQLINQTTLEDSQAEQDETIEGLQAELDRYKLLENALPHTENETPSGYVTLENTAKSPMTIETIPQTSQETTTGKNLFDKSQALIGKNWNGNDMAYSIASDFIKVTANNSYYFSVEDMPNYSSLTVVSFDTDKVYQNIITGNPFTIPSGIEYVKLSIRSASTHTWTQSELNDAKIQLEQGSTATSYEPYTGGIPAPNPDYPEDIHRTTGENEIEVYGETYTKNATWNAGYLNSSNEVVSSGSWKYSDYIDIEGATDYYVNGSGNAPKSILYDTNKNVLQVLSITNDPHYDLTQYNAKYIRISTTNEAINDQKVYQKTTYPISLGTKEMFNISNVSDGFVYDEATDKFYINRKIGKVVLDGSETWVKIRDYVFTNRFDNCLYPTSSTALMDCLCDKFTRQTNSSTWNDYSSLISYYTQTGGNTTVFRYDQTKEISDWTSWLSTHNTSIIYQLLNSNLEEVTDNTLISQLRAIKNALSMQGATHIISTSSGTNLPFLIKARAVQTIERT